MRRFLSNEENTEPTRHDKIRVAKSSGVQA